MLLKTKGFAHDVHEPIVARVTRNSSAQQPNQVLITEGELPFNDLGSFEAVLTNRSHDIRTINKPSVFSVQTLDHLADGDIVLINADGVINTLYRTDSHQNFLLTTERCNSNCLMCSQPPRDKNDIPFLYSVYKQLIPLIPKDCTELGLTGGEPTLLGELFFELLRLIKTELPETEVHCLTNGRTFAWGSMSRRLGDLKYHRLMLGIPLYADYYQVHDYIVQARDAFNQTMMGLYNLALEGQRIEVRVVLHKQSIPRLTRLARYIYKNLPFVEHIALMGLELQGYTQHNIGDLWIDPIEYMDEVGEAAEFLSSRGLNVSIYNSQLCLMPRALWKYNKNSISDWKNIFLPECSTCAMIDECGGLFASAEAKHSPHLKAFEYVVDMPSC